MTATALLLQLLRRELAAAGYAVRAEVPRRPRGSRVAAPEAPRRPRSRPRKNTAPE